MKYRSQRFQEFILRELSRAIHNEADFDPGILISLTNVNVSEDLTYAKIGVSTYPARGARGVITSLRKKAKDFQWQLTKKMRIKRAPELFFYIDLGLEKSARIDKIIKERKI